MATTSDEDLLAEGHYLARRLEFACRGLRAAVTRAAGKARAGVVTDLQRLVKEAEQLGRDAK